MIYEHTREVFCVFSSRTIILLPSSLLSPLFSFSLATPLFFYLDSGLERERYEMRMRVWELEIVREKSGVESGRDRENRINRKTTPLMVIKPRRASYQFRFLFIVWCFCDFPFLLLSVRCIGLYFRSFWWFGRKWYLFLTTFLLFGSYFWNVFGKTRRRLGINQKPKWPN